MFKLLVLANVEANETVNKVEVITLYRYITCDIEAVKKK